MTDLIGQLELIYVWGMVTTVHCLLVLDWRLVTLADPVSSPRFRYNLSSPCKNHKNHRQYQGFVIGSQALSKSSPEDIADRKQRVQPWPDSQKVEISQMEQWECCHPNETWIVRALILLANKPSQLYRLGAHGHNKEKY